MFKSLKQRLALLLIVPVAVLLLTTGLFIFIYARGALLDQWREAATLKLQRAAHHMDMRLSRPVEWINMFHKTAMESGGPAVQRWIIEQLGELEGVTQVKLDLPGIAPKHRHMSKHERHMEKREMMYFHRARIIHVTPPRYDTDSGQETVTLISDLTDEAGGTVGKLNVALSFDYLMQDIIRLGWWQSDLGCLVDSDGRYLAHTDAMMKGRKQLGETEDPIELKVLKNLREEPFGTVIDSGYTPETVSGFYRLTLAPWSIVLFAPGSHILSSVLRFRVYYTIAGSLCIALTLLLIRFEGGRLVQLIKEISQAASQVAKGNYGDALAVKRADEIGLLTRSFNTMIEGLKERDFISNTFGRYVDPEIAKELIRRPEASTLGGQKREVAILMSDIRGFTPLSERLSPEQTIRVLNHYFSHMIQVIQKHQGIIVDFFGDGVLVFFDPLEGAVEPAVYHCLDCALEMQASMNQFNAEMKIEGLPQLQIGVGVNVGSVVVGNIGSESRAKYGIVGSAVNITQRIQVTAKGGEIVISDSVYRCVSENLLTDRSFRVPLKGLEREIILHSVKGLKRQPAHGGSQEMTTF